jgi:hypothetical protein
LPKEERPKGVEFIEVRTLGEAMDVLLGPRRSKRAGTTGAAPDASDESEESGRHATAPQTKEA